MRQLSSAAGRSILPHYSPRCLRNIQGWYIEDWNGVDEEMSLSSYVTLEQITSGRSEEWERDCAQTAKDPRR